MKNTIAIIVCLLAVVSIAATGRHHRRTLEERVEALEVRASDQASQIEQLNYLLHQDVGGDIIIRGNLVVAGDYLITKKLYFTQSFQY